MKYYLSVLKEHLFELSFVSLLLKDLIFGTNLNDALVQISLLISIGYVKHYLTNKAEKHTDSQNNEIKELTNKVNSIQARLAMSRTSLNDTKK